MDREEVKKIVNSEINKFVKNEIDKEISKALKQNGSKTRAELLKTIKDAMEAVYKILWIKRDFWKTGIK